MPFGSLKKMIQDAAASVDKEAKKFSNKDNLDRATAVCVLVAYADGDCSSEEKQKAIKGLQMKMPHFDQSETQKSFMKNAESMEFDVAMGTDDLLKKLGNAQAEEANFLILLGAAVGGADGDFDDQEKAVLAKAARKMGLDPKEYDLE